MRFLAIAIPALLLLATPAFARPVLVLHGKRVTTVDRKFKGATELLPPSPASSLPKRQTLGHASRTALDNLLASGQIDQPTHDARTATIKRALRAYRALTGTRKAELRAVIANADDIASAGALTPSRLEPVFLTLERNTEWWTDGSIPANGARISFDGSQVIWQYYRGQGIELQMLANFGRVNALWKAKRRAKLAALVEELLPLASDRDGVLAWEYLFHFGGGAPPWTSAISQGTAIQALGRAAALLGDSRLDEYATDALGLFEQPPPTGVRRDTPDGAFYLIYTFAPDLLVLNAHLQATIGLYDFASLAGDPRAEALYASGEAEARVATPRYDTGAWSLYSLEREDDLSYHDLVTGFLRNLCERSGQTVYCDTADRFDEYRVEPPVVKRVTRRVRAGKPAAIRFSLDKISRVGMTITDPRGRTALATSAVVGRGTRSFTWRSPKRAGVYELGLSATDLAGNRAEPVDAKLRVLRRR